MKFWERKINNVNEISAKTGIEKEKIEALKNGNLEIKGETFDTFIDKLNKINSMTELEKQVEIDKIMKWYRETNIKKKMAEFNFNNQYDFAEKLGLSQGTVSMVMAKRLVSYAPSIAKMYYFFQDDFNKNTTVNVKNVNNSSSMKRGKYIDRSMANSIDIEEANKIKDFFDNHNVNEIYSMLGVKNRWQMSNLTGIPVGSLTHVLLRHYKSATPTSIKLYNFIKDYCKLEDKEKNPLKAENKVEKDQDNINILEDTKTEENEVKNEEIKGDKEEPIKNKKYIRVKRKSYLQMIKDFNIITSSLQRENYRLEKENIKLKKQIRRYEKLIDRLK